MRALVGAGMIAAALAYVAGAPLQCGHGHDPELRREDSPGDALWALAQEFRAKGNEDAANQTLRFLVDRYPSNRHAPAARAELQGSDAGP